jgi:hypothetical protein
VAVTKYGIARPISRGGLGGYEFPDEDTNSHIEYVFGPSDGKVLNKENIFRLGACQAQMHPRAVLGTRFCKVHVIHTQLKLHIGYRNVLCVESVSHWF